MAIKKNSKGFTQAQKNKILDKEFGNKKTITDPAGRKVTRNNAEVDHVVPRAKGGKNTLKNGQVLHQKTNKEKSDKLSGTIGPKSNQKTFKVNKNAKNPKMNVKSKK